MYHISIDDDTHDWHKLNLVSLRDRHGFYDIYKCQNCGISGKSRQLGSISIKATYSREKVMKCISPQEHTIPKRVSIVNVKAFNSAFDNLTPGSEHEVITPPNSQFNDHSGLWVMGKGEPVRLLKGEFIEVTIDK